MSTDTRITPVILAGGEGTRLWPVSRKSFPKQFECFGGEASLFQQALQRLSGTKFRDPLVLTGHKFRFMVTDQAAQVNHDIDTILIEPEGRDTAPAILSAALFLERRHPRSLMLVAPADHSIPNVHLFQDAIERGRKAAQAGAIITLGIAPKRPETGYGYLELSPKSDLGNLAPIPVKSFTEKPNAAEAERLLASGNHLWNAGIFLMRSDVIVSAYGQYQPKMYSHVGLALEGATPDLDFLRLDPQHWSEVAKISIDYAILEHLKDKILVVPYEDDWSDLGDWTAIWREFCDDVGMATEGDVLAVDCENSYLRSVGTKVKVVGLGLQDVVAVATNDAVLLADKSRCQEVKEIVARLRHKGDERADAFQLDHRPWGSFETLAISGSFHVKCIHVKPGGKLSLQSHSHRAEHWIVVDGVARATIDGKVTVCKANESIYVPLGSVHRLENPSKHPLTLIEVQTGSYFGEDDITRYEDVYSRS